MTIESITASYQAKRSDGAYGSGGVFCSMTASLDGMENAEEAYAELFATVRRCALEGARNEAVKAKEARLKAKENKV